MKKIPLEEFAIGCGRTSCGQTIAETHIVLHADQSGGLYGHPMDTERATNTMLLALPARNENHRPHRAHPAPPRIVRGRCVGRSGPRPARTRRVGDRTLARTPFPDYFSE